MSVDRNGELLIRGEEGNRVTIRRCTKNGPEGWFDTEVEVRCDGWRGKFGASFMQGELSGFAQQVQNLHQHLHGKATLEPIEPNLKLSLSGDGKGHVEINGVARNQFHTGTELTFKMQLDQTCLPGIAKALADIDPCPRTIPG
jgi:hypothetical protein